MTTVAAVPNRRRPLAIAANAAGTAVPAHPPLTQAAATTLPLPTPTDVTAATLPAADTDRRHRGHLARCRLHFDAAAAFTSMPLPPPPLLPIPTSAAATSAVAADYFQHHSRDAGGGEGGDA